MSTKLKFSHGDLSIEIEKHNGKCVGRNIDGDKVYNLYLKMKEYYERG